MYYFSPSERVFNYGASIWVDAVEVSDTAHAQIMKDLCNGYTIDVDGNGFPVTVPPLEPLPEIPIGQVFTKRLAKLNNDYELAIKYIKSTYPLSEAISWSIQLNEAKAVVQWQADNPTLTINDIPVDLAPFLYSLSADRMALGYPNDMAHLASRVITNDALFTPAFTKVTAIRHVTERAMLTAVELEDVVALKAVTWSFPFPPVLIE